MAAKNPVTDAILSVVGEYKSLQKDTADPKKRVPTVMQEPKKKVAMPRFKQALMSNGITRPPERFIDGD